MIRRHLYATFSTLALATAVSAAGCSEDEQAPARVIFESEIQPGANSPTVCPQTGSWLMIGSFGNPALGRVNPDDPNSPLKEPRKPVESGGADQQGTVSLGCTVAPQGDGFSLSATSTLSGATGGTVTMSGIFRATGEQTPVNVLVSHDNIRYKQTDCVATYDTPLETVAAGRLWAHFRCPAAKDDNGLERTCEIRGQVLFENCNQ